jgi:hypothetical protein
MVSKACRRNPKLRRHKLLVEVWEDTLEFGLLDFDCRYVVVIRFMSPISLILVTPQRALFLCDSPASDDPPALSLINPAYAESVPVLPFSLSSVSSLGQSSVARCLALSRKATASVVVYLEQLQNVGHRPKPRAPQ